MRPKTTTWQQKFDASSRPTWRESLRRSAFTGAGRIVVALSRDVVASLADLVDVDREMFAAQAQMCPAAGRGQQDTIVLPI